MSSGSLLQSLIITFSVIVIFVSKSNFKYKKLIQYTALSIQMLIAISAVLGYWG